MFSDRTAHVSLQNTASRCPPSSFVWLHNNIASAPRKQETVLPLVEEGANKG